MATQGPIVAIGECMVELARGPDRRFGHALWRRHLQHRRLSRARGAAVSYATALGDEPYSAGIIDLARREGVATDLVAVLPGRMPGLYLIETMLRRAHVLLLARPGAGPRAVRRRAAAESIAAAMPSARGGLFLRHHALALFARGSRPVRGGPRGRPRGRARRSPWTAISGRAAGAATSTPARARARPSRGSGAGPTSPCRPSRTSRRCGATQRRPPRSRARGVRHRARSW